MIYSPAGPRTVPPDAGRNMMPLIETMLGKIAVTVAWAMVPVVELRGAIPIGVAHGLTPWEAYAAAVVGNMLPVPFLILLTRRVFDWLRDLPWLGERVTALERRAHLKGRTVQKYRLPGLVILVAIPLPGTGAWTGALVASVLDIRLRAALPAIFLGVVIAGAIITALTFGVIHLF